MVHELSRRDARRIAVRAQLLDATRPQRVLDVVRHLTFLQVDLTAAVAPSADLVCWSRLGSRYAPAELDALLDQGDLVEFQGLLRPGEDLALYVDEMQRVARREGIAEWQHEVARLVRDQRRVPRGHPRRAAQRGAHAGPGPPGHLRGAVALERLERQQERPADARHHGAAR